MQSDKKHSSCIGMAVFELIGNLVLITCLCLGYLLPNIDDTTRMGLIGTGYGLLVVCWLYAVVCASLKALCVRVLYTWGQRGRQTVALFSAVQALQV